MSMSTRQSLAANSSPRPAAARACSLWPRCWPIEGLLVGQPQRGGRRCGSAADPRLNPLAPQEEPLSGQGQERDLAVHERRAEPGRYLGLQAGAGEARRQGAGRLRQEHRLLHRPGRAGDEVAVQVRPARPVRRVGQRDLSRAWPSTSTTWRSSTRATPAANNHSPGPVHDQHRHDADGLSRRVGSWVTYGLGSESQNLPAFVAMTDPLGRGLPKGYSQNWGAGFLPSVYPGHLAQAAGRPDRQPLPPQGPGPTPSSGPRSTCSAKLNKHRLDSSRRRSWSWPPGSRASSWPTACRSPRPRRSTSTRSRSTSTSCTASATSGATISPGSA